MGAYWLLLLFVVCCWGIPRKPINDFEEVFKEYSIAALDTISSIENILDSSKSDSESFINTTFSKNPVLKTITDMKSSDDECLVGFVDEDNLKLSYQIQIYQLQIPLRQRIGEIHERLNNINSSLNIYQGLVESKFQSCKTLSGNCVEMTNEWLQSAMDALSCSVYPNCSKHSVSRRSVCSPGQFSCSNGGCISGTLFCDSNCHCGDCSDRPPGCVKNCNEFRCLQTFRCIPLNKKCDGIDDCGDSSDEYGCPPLVTSSYTYLNCSIHAGDFLCANNKCIVLEKACDGQDDCGDLSDEGKHCNSSQCSPGCSERGGVCFTGPKGTECLYECPLGTYETSEGCSRNPEASLPTLLQVLEDTPRLMTRYAARLKYLQTKTTMAYSKSLREMIRCKKEEFAILSKIIDFSTIIKEEEREIEEAEALPDINVAPDTSKKDLTKKKV